jgi:hypothetical protein
VIESLLALVGMLGAALAASVIAYRARLESAREDVARARGEVQRLEDLQRLTSDQASDQADRLERVIALTQDEIGRLRGMLRDCATPDAVADRLNALSGRLSLSRAAGDLAAARAAMPPPAPASGAPVAGVDG